jgi:hypothetical protein
MFRQLLLLCLLLGTMSPLRADIVNGNFETGDLTGWTVVGATQATAVGSHTVQTPIRTPVGGVTTTPFAGSFQGLIRPGSFPSGLNLIEQTLGLAPLTLPYPSLNERGLSNGGAIYQDVTVGAGDRLSFRFSFTEQEDQDGFYADFGFYSITGPATSVFQTIRNPFVTGSPEITSGGYQLVNYDFAAAGTYRIGFGSANYNDITFDPALYVDGAQIQSAVAVPTPAGVVLGLVGMMTLGIARRSRRGAATT